MNRVVHFEIQADDVPRAAHFYKEVFGWHIEKWDGPFEYWFIMTAEEGSEELGINGGLMKRGNGKVQHSMVANAFVCTMQVADFDAIAEKIIAHGGEVAQPKYALPGMAWQGYFIDTEGNVFGIHQPDENAK